MDSFKSTAGYGRLAVLCFPRACWDGFGGKLETAWETQTAPIPPTILQVTQQRDGVCTDLCRWETDTKR